MLRTKIENEVGIDWAGEPLRSSPRLQSLTRTLALIGTPNSLILGVILLSREYDNWKPTLAIETLGLYTPADAQVPRHPPHARRDAHPECRDALAPGGAAPGTRWKR